MKVNNRLSSLTEYHFQKLDEIKNNIVNSGRSLTDLSIGDPDLPVDTSIIGGLIKGLGIYNYHNYPPYDGIKELKNSIIQYYSEVYSVNLDLDEVLILIGSKEGINNIIPAVCGIGDTAIIPKPAYPVYETCCRLWGVKTYDFVLEERNKYLPELSSIPDNIAETSKILIINYPNNPTGAVGNESFYKDILTFCEKNDIVLVNDGAYNEIIRPSVDPLSILRFDNKKQCIEFGTFSKIYNMTGFRIGYAVGSARVIKSLLKVKSNVDSGQFIPVQYSAIEALKLSRKYVDGVREIYISRKKAAEKVLEEHNVSFFKSEGTFYIWCRTPGGYNTAQFCEELLNDYGIVVTPGIAFGCQGINYFRIALTKDKEEIVRALSNLKTY